MVQCTVCQLKDGNDISSHGIDGSFSLQYMFSLSPSHYLCLFFLHKCVAAGGQASSIHPIENK